MIFAITPSLQYSFNRSPIYLELCIILELSKNTLKINLIYIYIYIDVYILVCYFNIR